MDIPMGFLIQLQWWSCWIMSGHMKLYNDFMQSSEQKKMCTVILFVYFGLEDNIACRFYGLAVAYDHF